MTMQQEIIKELESYRPSTRKKKFVRVLIFKGVSAKESVLAYVCLGISGGQD